MFTRTQKILSAVVITALFTQVPATFFGNSPIGQSLPVFAAAADPAPSSAEASVETAVPVVISAKIDDSAADSNSLASGAATIKSKAEVIYANLSASGKPAAAYVVNHFEIGMPGTILDFGDYQATTNLTNTSPLTTRGQAITFDAPAGNFYYQGDLNSTKLPWLIDITYFLDGIRIYPAELGGKNGALEIRIKTTPNPDVDPVYYDNYLLQIALTFKNDTSSDVTSEGATLANAGSSLMVTQAVMPGKNADISVKANVTNFEMDGISISAVPFSMNVDMPDTNDMVSDFQKLADGIADLNDGVGDLLDGVKELYDGTGELTDGSTEIYDGLKELSDHTGEIMDGSKDIKKALKKISDGLNDGMSDFSMDEFTQLAAALNQVVGGLTQVADNLALLLGDDENPGYIDAYDALDEAITADPIASISSEQLYTWATQTDNLQLAELAKFYMTVKGTYLGTGDVDGVQPAFAGVITALSALTLSDPTADGYHYSLYAMAAGLSQMSAGITSSMADMDIADQMEELADGIEEMADGYGEFHDGLGEFMDGVDELADGYSKFDTGLGDYKDGVGELVDGVQELKDGTQEMQDETADMPDTVQTEIDDMVAEYTGSDFQLVSFTSPLNEKIDLVQFVFKTENIKVPDVATDTLPVEQKQTIWDRFIALFTRQKD